jgi:glycosyltransferase involved in cell wall biosynthesis
LLARSLEVGGTERQLVTLAKALNERDHRVRVGVFYKGGALESEIAGAGIELVHLHKTGRWDVLRFLGRAVATLRRDAPDVIYSFLGGPNVAAAIVSRFLPKTKLVWSIRNSSFDVSTDSAAARLGFRVEAALASQPQAIIANSAAGRHFAIARGFPAGKIFVVPNGVDTDRFRPDRRLRTDLRQQLGLSDDDLVVGVLARLNATKDYPIFLRAARLVVDALPEARFVCAGGGGEVRELQRLTRELGIAERVLFPGQLDAAAALNAFDIACSASLTEGFPNAIGEAMACGLPCVVTDAGDSAAIVANLGVVVPVSDPAALAEGLISQIGNLARHNPGRSRARMVENFSISAMAERTVAIFRDRDAQSRGTPEAAQG